MRLIGGGNQAVHIQPDPDGAGKRKVARNEIKPAEIPNHWIPLASGRHRQLQGVSLGKAKQIPGVDLLRGQLAEQRGMLNKLERCDPKVELAPAILADEFVKPDGSFGGPLRLYITTRPRALGAWRE